MNIEPRRTRMTALFVGCALAIFSTAAGAGGLMPEEAHLLDLLDAKRASSDIRRLSQAVHTPSGLGTGTIVAGSVEERIQAEDITRMMRHIGLDVRLESFPVRAYRYGPVRLSVNGTPIAAVALHSSMGTWGSRDSVEFARGNEAGGHRLRASLIDAKEGYAADYRLAGDVRGKVVLVHREQRDWPEAQITEAAAHGALAILFYDYPNSGEQLEGLRQDSIWSHDQIPALSITRKAAQALARELSTRPVEVLLENQSSVADGQSQNVIGVIHGSQYPDEWVIVGAHYDRWFEGAGDNTSGVAAVLELARAFAASGVRPRRSLMFVATGSEEAGLEDAERDWLAGSHALVSGHPEIFRSTALAFNVDLLGWTSPSATLMSTPDIAAFQQQTLQDLGFDTTIKIATSMTSAIDAWNYGVVGGAAMNHLWRATFTGPDAYFSIYHTQLDTYHAAHFDNLPMDLRLLALSLRRAAMATRLPIALTAVADYVGPLLAADAARVPNVDFSAAQSALADFRHAAAAVEQTKVPADAERINRRLMAVRHELIPWLYISNGDFEQAVRTSEYALRVATLDKTIEALRHDNRDAAREALAGLYEGRQCLRLSPRVYAEEVGFWTGERGWSSQFQQRPMPPGPAFTRACAALGDAHADLTQIADSFASARSEAAQSVVQAIALMTTKLHAATLQLGWASAPK